MADSSAKATSVDSNALYYEVSPTIVSMSFNFVSFLNKLKVLILVLPLCQFTPGPLFIGLLTFYLNDLQMFIVLKDNLH